VKNFYQDDTSILPCDLADIKETQLLGEYATQYQKSMQRDSLDKSFYPTVLCLANQQEITCRMRKILVDWLVEVHIKFKLLPETLFITVNLIDRYCEKNQVLRKNYQLVGVTCMLISAKYEEIYPPYVKDFVYITDQAYTKEQILQQEAQILMSLDYKLTFPTCLRFLERYSKISECDSKVFHMSRYMLELSLIEVSMNKWSPSLLACSAIFVSKKILEIARPWSAFLAV
jgi:G2/mitotic-specific cyclin-B, other